ncbi:MAG: hypothetical protein O7D91_17565 [Planctomycetota bacterium]|nr:hypothetical protein [Planctomycetota bacterium]
MATEMVRICDVFPFKKDVRKVLIRVFVGKPGEDTPDNAMVELSARNVDLSQAAYERCMRFIDRGIVPPTKKGATDGDGSSS